MLVREVLDVAGDVLLVAWVLLADPDRRFVIHVEPVVVLLAGREHEEHARRQDAGQQEPVRGGWQAYVFGLVQRVYHYDERAGGALRGLGQQLGQEPAIVSGVRRERLVVEVEADYELGAHVLQELPCGADVRLCDVEVVHVSAPGDQRGGDRGLADARLAS